MTGVEHGSRRLEILRIANTVLANSGGHASIHEIAAATGILPGSLYHHFDSKDAIVVELFRRYHAALDQIGSSAQQRLDNAEFPSAESLLVDLAQSIAHAAADNQAAIQLAIYECHTPQPELAELMQRPPRALVNSMRETLRAGRQSGYIRPEVDLPRTADHLVQTMLQSGLGIASTPRSITDMAHTSCRILLDGLATRGHADHELSRSGAFLAAARVIDRWSLHETPDHRDKASVIRAAAREEFGRRGYEFTTVRDIAATAGVGTSTIFRIFDTKHGLLASIMEAFDEKQSQAWTAVLQSDSTAVEMLDALGWWNINVLRRFPDEFRMQLAWMRNAPTPTPNQFFSVRLRQLSKLLSAGIRSGEINMVTRSKATLARSVISLLWLPQGIADDLDTHEALRHQRDTVLRGIARRI